MTTTQTRNELTLKWGTLKRWDFTNSEKGNALLKEYAEIGHSAGAMTQDDTPRQKEIICELIDLCEDGTVYLDWEDKREIPINSFLKDRVLNTKEKVRSLLKTKEVPPIIKNKKKCEACSLKDQCHNKTLIEKVFTQKS